MLFRSVLYRNYRTLRGQEKLPPPPTSSPFSRRSGISKRPHKNLIFMYAPRSSAGSIPAGVELLEVLNWNVHVHSGNMFTNFRGEEGGGRDRIGEDPDREYRLDGYELHGAIFRLIIGVVACRNRNERGSSARYRIIVRIDKNPTVYWRKY
ncbi:hypothetical protein GWI33_013787 [Rhynchophorus ferrugineus]|uniref:Uncharacterized protein n=1 Tax=Rhynchophorus ferrugineus TaxID=354439 RepID=A0A834M9M8_RHYFE|nr:hypothetical protein GWI33_013787 [Rhynchophorus ferrugineus]